MIVGTSCERRSLFKNEKSATNCSKYFVPAACYVKALYQSRIHIFPEVWTVAGK